MNHLAIDTAASVRPEAKPFPIPAGESHTFQIDSFTFDEVRASMRGMRNHNRHHVSPSDSATWAKALRKPSGPDESVVVPGVQLLQRCEDLFIGHFGQGTTILAINYSFLGPLFTGQLAQLDITMTEVRNIRAFYAATFDSVTILKNTGEKIGVGVGHKILVPRLPIYPD